MNPIDDTFTRADRPTQTPTPGIPTNGGGQTVPEAASAPDPAHHPVSEDDADLHLSPELLQDELEVRETDPGEHRIHRAEQKISKHGDAIAAFRAEQGKIGDPELIDRIRASGICDRAQRYLRSALWCVDLDALAWFASLCILMAAPGWWRIGLAVTAVALAFWLSTTLKRSLSRDSVI
jgi:hypothetical protein